MNLYLNACIDFICAFIAVTCGGFATVAWVLFGVGFITFCLALMINKVEER